MTTNTDKTDSLLRRIARVLIPETERRRSARLRREWVREVADMLYKIDSERDRAGWAAVMDARLAVLHEVGPAVYIDASRALARRGHL